MTTPVPPTVGASPPAPLPLTARGDGIHVLTLEPNRGPMVVLDLALIQRIEVTLASVPRSCTGLILASGSPRVFVAGADLKQIESLDVGQLEGYLAFGQRVFGMLARLHCPTVAAINGAALGGGLELAMHCDGLVAAPPPLKDGQPGKPYPIGLPEAGLSICPGWGGTNMLPARMGGEGGPAEAIRMTATGRTMLVDAAVSCGLIQGYAPSAEALIETAAAWVKARGASGNAQEGAGGRRDGLPLRWIGRPNVSAAVSAAYLAVRDELATTDHARAVLKAIGAGLEHGWEAALKVEREELNRLRMAEAGRVAIRGFLSRH